MTKQGSAFVPGPRLEIAGCPSGSLSGRRFAAKDLFDVDGHVTGCGNPDWKRTHEPAAKTAPAITRLLEAGADLAGKTLTDELAFSLEGRNAHYGTPPNPTAPGCIPGGSSSGSASAVAAGDVDFALGTDTGGSVRIPAALCGLFGLRPSHGAISLDGVMPFAPGFDTVGFFARDADLLAAIGDVLLPGGETAPLGCLAICGELVDLADEVVRASFQAALDPLVTFEPIDGMRLLEVTGQGPEEWFEVFRVLQGHEIAGVHRAWIETVQPAFGDDIAYRFQWALGIADEDAAAAFPRRRSFREALARYLDSGQVLVFPTAPTLAPRTTDDCEVFADFRRRTLIATAVAGLGGCPQVTLPLSGRWRKAERPVGLSLLAAPGRDGPLLGLAVEIARRLQR